MKIRALIVDDEQLARQRVGLLLGEEPDVEVIGESGDGFEAVNQIEATRPDLVFLDVQMPEMDGFEVARILKSSSKTKNISIIFVTAISKDEHYVLKGFEEGAVDYLQKPLDISVTQAKVNVFEQLYFYQHDLKATAKELERINKQLERFVYIVSHDLKSPLASIITILSSMQ